MGDVLRKPSKKDLALVEVNAPVFLVMLVVLASPFAALSVFFVGIGVYEAQTQHRLNSNTYEVDAVVLRTEVVRSTSNSGTSSSATTSTSYYPVVEFAYEVGGTAYTSDTVWASGEGRSEASWAKGVISNYTPGDRVRALVSATDPSVAFLEVRWGSMPYTSMLFGSAMLTLLFSAGVWLMGWRWFGAATLVTVVFVGIGVFVAGWAVYLFDSQVPATARPGWWIATAGGSTVLSFLPVLGLWNARSRAGRYRRVLAWHEQQALLEPAEQAEGESF